MGDDLHHSHALVQPLEAEQLLDALAQVTGVPVQFRGYPLGLRANQVPAPPQSGRRGVDGMGERFLKVFGKPDRLLTCECERNDDPGLLQAFQLITGELMNAMIRDAGQPRRQDALGGQDRRGDAGGVLPRRALPQADSGRAEAKKLLALLASAQGPPRRVGETCLGLVNSKEFLLAVVFP